MEMVRETLWCGVLVLFADFQAVLRLKFPAKASIYPIIG